MKNESRARRAAAHVRIRVEITPVAIEEYGDDVDVDLVIVDMHEGENGMAAFDADNAPLGLAGVMEAVGQLPADARGQLYEKLVV